MGRVVQLGLEAVAESAHHLHVLPDHLDVLAADLDHGPLVVTDLGHGATLGLLESVTRDLLEVSLLESSGLVCEVYKVLGGSPLRFILVATRFLLVTILFVPLLLEMFLFIFVHDFICVLVVEPNTELDSTGLFILLVVIILFLILLRVYNRLVTSVYFPREIGLALLFCCK